MILTICDIITTIFQTFLFVWIPNSIAVRQNKLSKFKYYMLMLIIFINVVIFTYSGINIPIANFFMVLVILLFTIIFYSKSIKDGFIGFGLGYSIVMVSAYFFSTFYLYVIVKLNLVISTELQRLVFIYAPIWITYFGVYKFRKYIFDTVIALKELKNSLIFILIFNYAIIFFDSLHLEWTTESMGLIFKSTLYIISLTTFIFAMIYFAKINDKSKEMELLNTALNEKIIELKKIKHDYGSEISSLYGLYQLGKMDRIGQLLKGIVGRYQEVSGVIDIKIQATSLVASVLNYAANTGINLIVFDGGNYQDLAITENQLLKLLTNIVKNSVDALQAIPNPTIKFKSYNSYKGIIINIINNGPEIPKDIKNKMFQAEFTTKDNKNGYRGFGLSIVADIIKDCNGQITVESNKEWTQFKIEIPYRAS